MTTAFQMAGAMSLRKIAELKLKRPIESRLGFKLMPMSEVNEVDLIYERRDVIRGLQFARGINGTLGRVNSRGINAFTVSPGYYAEYYGFDEEKLIKSRQVGSWMDFDPEGALLAEAADILTTRALDRKEANIWSFMLTGGFEAKNIQGVSYHQPVYAVDAYTPAVLFNVLATATPLNYLRQVIWSLNQRGYSVDFSPAAGQIIMSNVTLQNILNNTNAADIGGRRLDVGSTVNDVDGLNKILVANSIPPITIYDKGYFPEGTGAQTLFVPDGKILIVGNREDGAPFGEYRMTKAVQNANLAPGDWYRIADRRPMGEDVIFAQCGHNGGPAPYYPEAVAVINAY